MILAYRDKKGRVRCQEVPNFQCLASQPHVLEIIGEISRMPGPGEKLDSVTLKIVEDARVEIAFDAKAEIEALKARVAKLECGA